MAKPLAGTLSTWNDGAAKNAIVEFVEGVADELAARNYVPPIEPDCDVRQRRNALV